MPLKRHEALQDLSRDHQRFLLEARSMNWIAVGDKRAVELQEFIELFTVFWEYHGAPHIAEEETVLFPFVIEKAEAAINLDRINQEHAWMQKQVKMMIENPAAITAELIGEIGQNITQHIRHEERVVYEAIQDALSEAELQALGEQLLAFRREHRPSDAIGPHGGTSQE